jgi:integrase
MPRKKSGRKAIPEFGIRGRLGKRGKMVRGFLELGLARVQWCEQGRRRTASWPDTPENRARAIAFAEGVLERLNPVVGADRPTYEPLTLRQMWERYQLAEFTALRPRTRDNYLKRWGKFERFLGRDYLATKVTRETLDEFRAELRKLEHEVNQIQRHVQMVKSVFKWAVDRDLIPPTKVTTYRFKRARDEKIMVVPEYSPDEARRLLAQFDPRDARDWRGYVATYLFAFAGPRQNAARHLTWSDVDLVARTIKWPSALDKLGKERTQPIPEPVVEALWVAYGWRCTLGYVGPYVIFRPGAARFEIANGLFETARQAARAAAKPDRPWTYSAYNARLRRAEISAKVPHIDYRAAHGFRRFVLTEALRLTGNLVLAGQYIGDTDVRTLQRSYVRERPEELRGVAELMGGAKAAGPQEQQQEHGSGQTRNATATDAQNDETPPESEVSQTLISEPLT